MSDLPEPVRAVLAGRTFAHLATTARDGSPRSVPVWIDVEEDGRLVMFTQSTSAKSRNIERDGRVAISAVNLENPYEQCDVRGRVVERIDGDAAHEVADRLAVKYTGTPFPFRPPTTVAYVIAPEASHHVALPFTHEA